MLVLVKFKYINVKGGGGHKLKGNVDKIKM